MHWCCSAPCSAKRMLRTLYTDCCSALCHAVLCRAARCCTVCCAVHRCHGSWRCHIFTMAVYCFVSVCIYKLTAVPCRAVLCCAVLCNVCCAALCCAVQRLMVPTSCVRQHWRHTGRRSRGGRPRQSAASVESQQGQQLWLLADHFWRRQEVQGRQAGCAAAVAAS